MFVGRRKRTIFIKKKFSCWGYNGSSENNRQDLNFHIPSPDVAQLGSNVYITLQSSAYSHIFTCGCSILPVWYEFYPWDTVCFYPTFVCVCLCVCLCLCVCVCVCVLYCFRSFLFLSLEETTWYAKTSVLINKVNSIKSKEKECKLQNKPSA